jgi:hypothetical protein
MAKTKVKRSPWMLLIEFNGLCAAELVKPPKGAKREMIIHFVHDSMHHPILAVRDRDVIAAQDCQPAYKVLTYAETMDRESGARIVNHDEMGIPTTVSLWPATYRTHQEIVDAKDWSLKVDTSSRALDKSEPPKPANPNSLQWLPTLDDILGSKKCNPLHDFAQFRLKEGEVIPGRLDKIRTWSIKVGDYTKREGHLAVTIIYKLVVEGDFVVLDLHPGFLKVGPSEHDRTELASGRMKHYTVEMTYSSLPVSTLPHHSNQQHAQTVQKGPHPSTQHFNEYNRLVGTDKIVAIEELTPRKRTVEDPIHCFDAVVLP